MLTGGCSHSNLPDVSHMEAFHNPDFRNKKQKNNQPPGSGPGQNSEMALERITRSDTSNHYCTVMASGERCVIDSLI